MEAKSFKFLRKRPRAHAGKTRALPAEESLKNDWEQKREKKKKSEEKGIIRLANRRKVSRRGWSRPKLSLNYRQTIVATDLVFEPRRVYDVPKILCGSSPLLASVCIHTKKFPF